MDVFLATDFHGGPFRGREEGHHHHNGSSREKHNHAAAAADLGLASASQSGCDVSLGSMSLAATERGATASVVVGGGDRVVERPERPWFSQRVLTAG